VNSPLIRIGTRASQLALWQANWVAERLRTFGVQVEIVEISTTGDRQPIGSLAGLGLQGVFTKEIQAAVLAGQVDLAVHSLKDLPTEILAGLTLVAVPLRETVADALVSNRAGTLAELPAGVRIGTGSLRRQAQLKHLRPDIEVIDIRGNVDTRLSKLDEGQYDAVVLAAAGLTRLGWQDRITELLAPPRMLPAVGQGALGIECRLDDSTTQAAVAALDDRETRAAVTAERVMLSKLHGGCSAPVGAWGRMKGDSLALDAVVASCDGVTVLRASGTAAIGDAAQLGYHLADELLTQGAAEIIAAARRQTGELK
jgi:hydroxymethylbilane synthase